MKIEIQNIKKRFGSHRVLEGISLCAVSGECVGILGGNGCGKSTLLSILAGIQRPDAGAFLYEGKDLFSYTRQRSTLVGYVPQGTPLIEELSARDNLLLWYGKKELEQELSNGVLKLLGIGEFLKKPVHTLSGGMKKRLSIGCAVSQRPPILLLDEPTAALDLPCKQQIHKYLATYKRAGGILLLTTHDVTELALCDRLYILREGRLVPYVYDGDPEKLSESL